jgi:hypothetical protein
MKLLHARPLMTRTRASVFVVVGLSAWLTLAQAPAHALTVFDTPTPVTGNATWFSGLGGPYGGCGMTQDALETQNFVALNVYDTPGDYTDFYQRPIAASLATKMGMWNNGHNCDRWVQVTIGNYCTGVNDGAQNLPFCRGGSWIADKYNGATLNMIVADSCGDGNAWCRDDPYHLDLVRSSLNSFLLNGVPVADMDPAHWNNRQISWKFISAPNYTGDIQIGFLQGAQTYWAAMAVSHLPNGIHAVEYYANGTWTSATMDGDMGQAYIIQPLVAGGTYFEIRVRDVTDTLINSGRVYSFSLPSGCAPQCSPAYTQISYTTSTTPVTPTTSSGGTSGTCTATYQTANTWPGGFQGQVTVTAGTAPINGWTVTWNLASGQTIGSNWNGIFTTSGSTVTVKNVSYNAALTANASTTFGFVSTGTPSTPTLSCTSP